MLCKEGKFLSPSLPPSRQEVYPSFVTSSYLYQPLSVPDRLQVVTLSDTPSTPSLSAQTTLHPKASSHSVPAPGLGGWGRGCSEILTYKIPCLAGWWSPGRWWVFLNQCCQKGA